MPVSKNKMVSNRGRHLTLTSGGMYTYTHICTNICTHTHTLRKFKCLVVIFLSQSNLLESMAQEEEDPRVARILSLEVGFSSPEADISTLILQSVGAQSMSCRIQDVVQYT